MAEFTTILHSTIEGYQLIGASDDYFAKVFKGHPQNLAPLGGRPQARWYTNGTTDAPEGARNLKNDRMVQALFTIQCYWDLAGVENAQVSQEAQIAEVMIGLPALLVAITPNTYTIAGKLVAVVTVDAEQPVDREFLFPNTDQEGVVLTITARARILEAS